MRGQRGTVVDCQAEGHYVLARGRNVVEECPITVLLHLYVLRIFAGCSSRLACHSTPGNIDNDYDDGSDFLGRAC